MWFIICWAFLNFSHFSLFSVTEEVVVTPTVPITPNAPHQMPLLMQLYTSPDYRSPLDANTKVQSDKRIYAEVRNHSPPLLFTTLGCCPLNRFLCFSHSVVVNVIFSLFPADFREHFRGYCLDHQGDQMCYALQGLVHCSEGAALHARGLLLKFLSQQHPTQLLLRSAPRAVIHHMGPGMLRQTLLQWGRSLTIFTL